MIGLLQAVIGLLLGYSAPVQAGVREYEQQQYYQTWYIATQNHNQEQLHDLLEKLSAKELQLMLQMIGVDLILSDTTPPPTPNADDPILEEDFLIYANDLVSLCVPRNPRVPHHLRIVLNRPKSTLTELSTEEATAMQAMLKTVATVLRERFETPDFVVARSNLMQYGQWGVTMEIIPPRPDSRDVLNVADKIDCNRYVHYRHLPLPEYRYHISDQELETLVSDWKAAMRDAWWYAEEDTVVKSTPKSWVQISTELDTAQAYLIDLFYSALELEGFAVRRDVHRPFPKGERMRIREMTGCAFCRHEVLDYQRVYEESGICILYNHVSPIEAGHFLVLPTRHCEQLEMLTAEECRTRHALEIALIAALEEEHGHGEVLLYTQNAPSVGQTISHTHDKVQVVKLIPHLVNVLRYTLGAFELVSAEEMQTVTQRIGDRIRRFREQAQEDAA